MKCHSCGNELHMEEERCPYCGAENLYYKKHRFAMKKYRKDFDEVKEDVYKKTGFFTGFTVRITIIAVLVAVNIGMLFLCRNIWSIEQHIKIRELERNRAKYVKVMDELEAEGKFYELSVYYDENSLYYGDVFDEYESVTRMCSYYTSIYRDLLLLYRGQEETYITTEELITRLCENIEYMYKCSVQKEYENPERFSEQHKAAMEKIKEEVECMLVAYANLTPEQAEGFEGLSNGRKQIAIEEGLGLYEE